MVVMLVFIMLTACASQEIPKEAGSLPSLSGVWSYSEGRGECIISQIGDRVTMEWTYLSSSITIAHPQYLVETTLHGLELSGRWRFSCSAEQRPGCNEWYSLRLKVYPDYRVLKVIEIQDPYSLAGARGMLLIKKN